MVPCVLITLIATVALEIVICTASSNDPYYCHKKAVCKDDLPNIGCDCGPRPSAQPLVYGHECFGKKPLRINLDTTLKALILQEHNGKRNSIACGSVTSLPPAARMVEVSWDDELQYLAWCNARRCVYGHDKCRNTDRYYLVGQNIASQTYCGGKTSPTPEEVIKKSVNVWYQEYKNTTPAMIDKYPGKQPGFLIGHFTLVVNEHLQRIGCSLIEYNPHPNKMCKVKYFVCNYSYININLHKTYTKSKRPAVECITQSQKYPCLCSNKEPITPPDGDRIQ